MLSAVAMVAYLVQSGDTLSRIAASHGVSLAAVEAANPQIHDYNLIYIGQTVQIPARGHASSLASVQDSADTASVQRYNVTPARTRTPVRLANASPASVSSGAGYGSSALDNIPGVPKSFAACVAYRESTDLQNPAARGNAYGIIPASGYNVYGTSLAYQKQVFAELYAKYGTAPWASDGC
jgi:LysM repeat protein